MPREVKRFGCEFRCGSRLLADKKKVIEHERQCFLNPENRTCLTCENEFTYNTMEDQTHKRSCVHPVGAIRLELMRDDLISKNGWVKPIYHCPQWNVEVTEDVLKLYDKK